MKNIIFKIGFLSLVVLFGCSKEDDITLKEANHRVIFTSEIDFENTIEINGRIDFGDVSSGVESRLWTFPEGAVDILDADNDVTSTEAVVQTIFTQVGEFPVRLQQTFKDDAYAGTTLVGRELDTTILVTVLDTIVADVEAFYINEDGSAGEPLVLSDLANNEVFAARSIRYVYTGTGEPESITWITPGTDPAFSTTNTNTGLSIDVQYKFLGTYDLTVIPFRPRPNGRDTISFESFITVAPSTDPLLLENVVEDDGTIKVFFGRELAPETVQAEDFVISISNGGKGYESKPSFTVSAESNVVTLVIENETLYNDDIVTVSFTEGNLTSLDGVKGTAFDGAVVTFNKVNLLESTDFDSGFETLFTDNWKYLGWGEAWDGFRLTISEDNPYEGNKSMLVEIDANDGMIIGLKNDAGEDITFPVNADQDYELGIWVYVEELGNNDPAGNAPDLRIYWAPNTNWSQGPNPAFPASFKVGEWVYSSTFIQFNETENKTFMLRGFNADNSETLRFYMDNIVLAEVALRP